MSRLGIVEAVSLAATLALAAPLALFGATRLASGHADGALFVVLAGVLVALSHVLTTPTDLPGRVLEWVAGRVAVREED